jgi:mRNA interferase MazF
MNSGHVTRTARIARISALGLGVGLALSACNASTSSAASSATPSASAPTATASAAASGSGSAADPGASATPQNVNGQPLALLDCEGNPQVEPTKYELDCFDAINDLDNLHWTRWGQIAVATGTEELNACIPACTTHKSTYYPVTIQVAGLDVSGQPHTYTKMTISYAGAMPVISSGETGGQITQRQSNSWSEKLPVGLRWTLTSRRTCPLGPIRNRYTWAADAGSAAGSWSGGRMQRGEVWWVEFDERRPVVLLSEEDSSGFAAMQVVAAAGTDFSGLGIEVAVGALDGLPFEGVLRVAFPWPGFTPCTWLTTLSRDDLIERAGALSPAKLSEIDNALAAAEQRTEWTPAAAARLSEIKDSLRRRAPTDGEGTDRTDV